MPTKTVLITGANGEVGHELIHQLSPDITIVTFDIRPLDESLVEKVHAKVTGDILDMTLLTQLMSEYNFDEIYHLAAMLSTHAERDPQRAHQLNVGATLNLLQLAIEHSRRRHFSMKFIFPSSVAVYGMPDLKTKSQTPPVHEDEFTVPITMYGCNKLYCENLGRYYTNHYGQLDPDNDPYYLDFRALRFPGLISAITVPSGGTSDYIPEMAHAAAQGKSYPSFVRADTTLPFMMMPDAIKAIRLLAESPRERLTRIVYNVTSFSLSAGEAADIIKAEFPEATITFKPDTNRQRIVDSWPAALDDRAARHDWNWMPDYDLQRAFHEYLFPTLIKRYQAVSEMR